MECSYARLMLLLIGLIGLNKYPTIGSEHVFGNCYNGGIGVEKPKKENLTGNSLTIFWLYMLFWFLFAWHWLKFYVWDNPQKRIPDTYIISDGSGQLWMYITCHRNAYPPFWSLISNPCLTLGVCSPWREKSCCSKDMASAIGNMYEENYCAKQMSSKCKEKFQQVNCFRQCSSNLGLWILNETSM